MFQPKRKPTIKTMKMAIGFYALLAFALFLMLPPVVMPAAIILVVFGVVIGGTARDVEYAEQSKPIELRIPDELRNSDAYKDFYDAMEKHQFKSPRRR